MAPITAHARHRAPHAPSASSGRPAGCSGWRTSAWAGGQARRGQAGPAAGPPRRPAPREGPPSPVPRLEGIAGPLEEVALHHHTTGRVHIKLCFGLIVREVLGGWSRAPVNAQPGPGQGPCPDPPGGGHLTSPLGPQSLAPPHPPSFLKTAGTGIRKEAARPPSPFPHSRRQLGPLAAGQSPVQQAGETEGCPVCSQRERRPSHLLPWLSGARKAQLLPLPQGMRPGSACVLAGARHGLQRNAHRCLGALRPVGGVLGAEGPLGEGGQRPCPLALP